MRRNGIRAWIVDVESHQAHSGRLRPMDDSPWHSCGALPYMPRPQAAAMTARLLAILAVLPACAIPAADAAPGNTAEVTR